MKHVIVVGGGPAGMMGAIWALRSGNRVTLIEKNEKLGKKLFITGKGRCNITNSCDTEQLFDHVISNPKFLYSAFYSFDNREVIRYFEEKGCLVKEERGGRIFPVSDHSSDVIRALEKELKGKGAEILLNRKVKELLIGEEKGRKKATGVMLDNNRCLQSDCVILATGGVSYPSTGSTGDGYLMAARAGHEVVKPRPSLVPLIVKEEWCRRLQGLSLKNVSAILSKNGKKLFEGLGEMIFTHFGVSGPLILTGSSYCVDRYSGTPVILTLDLKPGLTYEQLDKRVLRDFSENHNRQFKNGLDKLLPSKIIPVVIELSGIDERKKVNEISRKERERLISLLKGLSLTITGSRPVEEGIITRGGVPVKEVNAQTMESKLLRGLYFAGEMLDVDGLTGGYNLQIAWSTGYLAGTSTGGGKQEEN